jgi:NADPH-dependent 2,4-dienoyl-CoA reductase/sulfur reductase-like enzyme
MPFASLPDLGTFIQGKAVDLTPEAVLLEDGRSVPYDHLVIATGCAYSDPVFKGGSHLQEKKRLLKV